MSDAEPKTFVQICNTIIDDPSDMAALYHGLKDQRPITRDAKYLKQVLLRVIGFLHDQHVDGDDAIDLPPPEPPVAASTPTLVAGPTQTQAAAYVAAAERMLNQHNAKDMEKLVREANLGRPLLVELYKLDERKGVRAAIESKFSAEDWDETLLDEDGEGNGDGDGAGSGDNDNG